MTKPATIAPTSEYTTWSLELREAWDALTSPQRAHVTRARLAWRAMSEARFSEHYPSTLGLTRTHEVALHELWKQEVKYRASAHCRGAHCE